MFNRIIVTDIDRLVRLKLNDADKALERGQFQSWLIRCELKIETPYGQITDPNDVLSDLRLSLTAEDGRKRDERFLRGKREKAGQGFFCGGKIPFGFETYPVGQRTKLRLNDQEVPIVKRIFDLALQGYGTPSIGEILDSEGIKPPKGGTQWRYSSVSVILKNPIYKGENHYDRKRRISQGGKTSYENRPESEHVIYKMPEDLTIIPKQKWEAVHGLISKRNILHRISSKKPRKEYLLVGLLACKHCYDRGANKGKGYRLCGKVSGSEHVGYYTCYGTWHRYGGECHTGYHKMESINKRVCEVIYKFLNNPEEILKHRETLEDKRTSNEELQHELERLEKLLGKNRLEEDRMMNAYRKGIFDEEQVGREMEYVKLERATLERNLQDTKAQIRSIEEFSNAKKALIRLGMSSKLLTKKLRREDLPLYLNPDREYTPDQIEDFKLCKRLLHATVKRVLVDAEANVEVEIEINPLALKKLLDTVWSKPDSQGKEEQNVHAL